jgi:hypothetical protein
MNYILNEIDVALGATPNTRPPVIADVVTMTLPGQGKPGVSSVEQTGGPSPSCFRGALVVQNKERFETVHCVGGKVRSSGIVLNWSLSYKNINENTIKSNEPLKRNTKIQINF